MIAGRRIYEKINQQKNRENTAFLYERISRDDNLEGDSYSVANQKKLLIKVAKEKGFTNLVHFFDDGISGVTMDRPGFNEMIAELEAGHAAVMQGWLATTKMNNSSLPNGLRH